MKQIIFLIFTLMVFLCSCQARTTPVPSVSAVPPEQSDQLQTTSQTSPYDSGKISQINLVLSYSGPRTSVNGYWAEQYKQRVEELSSGKITIDVYSDSILGSDLEVMRDCQYGTVDIQIATPAALVTFIPQVAVFDMPFLFQDLDSARNALADETLFDYIAQAYASKNLILLPLTDQGFRTLSLSEPIESLQDFDGLTIRCMYNQHHIDFWQALGVQTVCMDISDTYLALQKGGVQGQENPYGEIFNRKFYEVQKYMTNSNHLLYIGGMHISKITWDSLSSTAQDILWQSAEECRQILPDYVDQANQQALEQMSREGSRLIDFNTIPGLWQQCQALTYDVAYASISAVTGTDILDHWCGAAKT